MRILPAIVFASVLLPIGVAWADDSYTITLSAQYINYIFNVLGQRPYSEVKPIIELLQAQIAQANAAKATPPVPSVKDDSSGKK